jgi:hypothetical protein
VSLANAFKHNPNGYQLQLQHDVLGPDGEFVRIGCTSEGMFPRWVDAATHGDIYLPEYVTRIVEGDSQEIIAE